MLAEFLRERAAGAEPAAGRDRQLARRGAHCLLIVKGNQPGLYAQLAALPWRDVPTACTKRERGHGRAERRTLKITSVAGGRPSPMPPRPSGSCAAAQ
jgi:hypothetical protein